MSEFPKGKFDFSLTTDFSFFQKEGLEKGSDFTEQNVISAFFCIFSVLKVTNMVSGTRSDSC